MRSGGRLKTWNDERGFGFIEPFEGGEGLFVHIKAFAAQGGRPEVGQLLSFEVEAGPQGKKRAMRVETLRHAVARRQRARSVPPWRSASLFAIPLFLVLYSAIAWLWRPPWIVAGVYVVASLATFLAYALDKSAATRGARRTPESTLHLLALCGGWPGALVAQQWLRHKSAKAEFCATFRATVGLNALGLTVLCSPVGRGLWEAAAQR